MPEMEFSEYADRLQEAGRSVRFMPARMPKRDAEPAGRLRPPAITRPSDENTWFVI